MKKDFKFDLGNTYINNWKGFEGSKDASNPMYEYERDLLKTMIDDKSFGIAAMPFISPNDFTNPLLREIYWLLKDTYQQSGYYYDLGFLYTTFAEKAAQGQIDGLHWEELKAMFSDNPKGINVTIDESRKDLVMKNAYDYIYYKAIVKYASALREIFSTPDWSLDGFHTTNKEKTERIREELNELEQSYERWNNKGRVNYGGNVW